jgi:antitoxin VapB
MASLYIKDQVTASRVADLSRRLGTTKTETVRRALEALEHTLPPEEDLHARIAAWRRAHPLGRPTGLEADKAFYDSLYEDDDL